MKSNFLNLVKMSKLFNFHTFNFNHFCNFNVVPSHSGKRHCLLNDVFNNIIRNREFACMPFWEKAFLPTRSNKYSKGSAGNVLADSFWEKARLVLLVSYLCYAVVRSVVVRGDVFHREFRLPVQSEKTDRSC